MGREERAGHPHEVDAQLVDALVELGPDELGHRPLGPRRPRRAQGAGPHVGEAGHLGLHPQRHQAFALGGGLVRPSPSRCAAPRGWGPSCAPRTPAADGDALVHQRGHGHPPPGAHGVEALRVGDADVGEEHLVELGVAGDLAQGAHLDARRVHVDDEVRHAPVLGHVGVGAGQEHAPARRVGQGRPHLLAVHHPLVTVAHRPGGEPGHVGSRPGLAEELAPDLLAREQGAQVAGPLLVGAVREDRGGRHAVADDVAVGLVRARRRPAARARRGPGGRGSTPRPPRPDGERHPGQPGVEAGAEELHRRRGDGVVVGRAAPGASGADEVLVGADGVGDGHTPTLTTATVLPTSGLAAAAPGIGAFPLAPSVSGRRRRLPEGYERARLHRFGAGGAIWVAPPVPPAPLPVSPQAGPGARCALTIRAFPSILARYMAWSAARMSFRRRPMRLVAAGEPPRCWPTGSARRRASRRDRSRSCEHPFGDLERLRRRG